jgi:uncharacterized protein (TIGR02266 family)
MPLERCSVAGAQEETREGTRGEGEADMATVSLESDGGDGGEVGDERRRTERAGVTVRIDYATVDEMFSEFTRDINEGGLFIETEKPHQPGTEVVMQFHLPGSEEVLRTVGRVVRVSSGDVGSPPGMGIEFDELTPVDRDKIDRIVRALRSRGGADSA